MAVLSDLTLANYLKIVSKGAVYNNLSEDSRIWEFIKKKKKEADSGRYMHFLLKKGYGATAVGFVKPDGDYPAAAKSKTVEGKAEYKDFALSVEAERSVIARALNDMSRYGDVFAQEMRDKTNALARILSAAVYQDGTGVLGEVLSHTVPSGDGAGVLLTITLKSTNAARGHVGWFEMYDQVVFRQDNATPPTQGDVPWEVVERKRELNQIVLKATAAHTQITANHLDNYNVYRAQQPTKPNLTTLTDYGLASEAFIGLASLSQNDSRIANGITLDKAVGGTRLDAGGQPIDTSHFQQLMSQVMVNVGQSRYKYDAAMMAWETLDALIESREVDRKFNTIEDNKRGVKELGYQHGRNSIIFSADEYCPKSKIYVIPNADVIQFYGSDFEVVKPDGGKGIMLKTGASAGTYARSIQLFMEGTGCIISVHSPAIGVIENFTV